MCTAAVEQFNCRLYSQQRSALPCVQLDKATADASEFKAGLDKASADAAEFKAGFDKFSADAAEFKAGFDKAAADAAEFRAEAELRKNLADTALAKMNRMAEDMSQVNSTVAYLLLMQVWLLPHL